MTIRFMTSNLKSESSNEEENTLTSEYESMKMVKQKRLKKKREASYKRKLNRQAKEERWNQMDEERRYVKGACPFPGCGSSDAFVSYSDGVGHCFSCGRSKKVKVEMDAYTPASFVELTKYTDIDSYRSYPITSRGISKEVVDYFNVKMSVTETGMPESHYYPSRWITPTRWPIRRLSIISLILKNQRADRTSITRAIKLPPPDQRSSQMPSG